ncbi:hypothetical protein OHA71_06595 [Streptomyces sp. NBC_00444]|uniref:hypothetical protein n=1 Tax=Streptomyces sp. NBC_00444 TaxID=2975744 RepID=UPI002E1ABD85
MTDPTADRYRCAEEAEAVQWTGSNADALRAFCGSDFDTIDPEDRSEDPDETAAVRSHSHGGWLGLKPGDWVVKHADHFSTASDEEFRAAWEPTAVPVAVPPATALRDRIRRAVCEAEGFAWDSDMLEPDEYGEVADTVLAVLPADLAQAIDQRDYWHQEAMHATARIIELERKKGDPALPEAAGPNFAHTRKVSDKLPEPADRGAEPVCICGHCEVVARELRRVADEAQQPDVAGACHNCKGSGLDPRYNGEYVCPDCPTAETPQPETQAVPEAEDPARVDRLRPEFFEHASVESIDFQIQRAQRQQRHWGNRERTLTILRQARVTQKEHGEWPAAAPAVVSEPGKETS